MYRQSTITAQPAAAVEGPPRLVTDDDDRRLRRLHDDEDGAQAVEYAMIAGLGAAFIGFFWKLLTDSGLVQRVIQVLIDVLVSLVTSWFSGL